MEHKTGFEKEYETNSYHLTNYIVQNNHLLKGKFRIALPSGEKRPLKTKELLTLKQFISLIDIEKPHIYLEISKKDNIRFVHANSNNKLHNMNYTRCQEYCNNLKEAYFILEDTKFKVFEKMKWDKNTNYVGYSFTREMFKYLANQESNFTVYQIGYLKKLKSINEIKLYEYLKMNIHRNKKENWKWVIKLDALKELLDLEDRYLENKIFFRAVLKPTLKEINKPRFLDIVAIYSYDKETKKITFVGKNTHIPKNNLKKIDKSNSNTTTKEPSIDEKKQVAVTYKEKKIAKFPSKVKEKKELKYDMEAIYAAADNPENQYIKP